MIMSLLRQNDITKSFRRSNDVIITSFVRWDLSFLWLGYIWDTFPKMFWTILFEHFNIFWGLKYLTDINMLNTGCLIFAKKLSFDHWFHFKVCCSCMQGRILCIEIRVWCMPFSHGLRHNLLSGFEFGSAVRAILNSTLFCSGSCHVIEVTIRQSYWGTTSSDCLVAEQITVRIVQIMIQATDLAQILYGGHYSRK